MNQEVNDKILAYLSKHTTVTKELEIALNDSTFFKKFEKGAIILKEGRVASECYFIVEGCIRSYFIKDGEEKNTEFYTEEEVVTPTTYGTNSISPHYLECIEDTIVSIGTPELEKEAFEKHPILESLSRIIAERVLNMQSQAFAEFRSSSPVERYENLMKTRPDLIQRIPQYQLASYLGMKPESLSRIRKRIMNKS